MTSRLLWAAAAGALAFALAGFAANAAALAVCRLAICGAALAAAAVVDAAEHRIPNRVVLPAAAVCAAFTLAGGARSGSLAGGLLLVALLLVLSLARPAALGMGDVKLALLIAFGLDGSAPGALLLGVALAALTGVVLVIRRGSRAWRSPLPLAPFLSIGALAALLV